MLIKFIKWLKFRYNLFLTKKIDNTNRPNEEDCYVTFIFPPNGKTIIKSDSRGSMYGFYISTKEGYVASILESELRIKSRETRNQSPDSLDNLHYPPSQFYNIIEEDKE